MLKNRYWITLYRSFSNNNKPEGWEDALKLPNNFFSNFKKQSIPYNEFQYSFLRSSGPGGQNVNKVASKVEARFQIDKAHWLPMYIRKKLIKDSKYNNRTNKKGEFVIANDSERSQLANKEKVIDKIYQHIQNIYENEIKPPDPNSLKNVENILKKGSLTKERNKRINSLKKANRKGKEMDF